MKKYLVIATVGDRSMHYTWLDGKPEFDLVLIYYGNNDSVAKIYSKHTPYFYRNKGQKYPLIKEFISSNEEFVSRYSYIWLVDDDISISTEKINEFLSISEQYDLYISQPSLKGYYSLKTTLHQPGNLLRFTNFVEAMAPLLKKEILFSMLHTFDDSPSGWGLDFAWVYLLGYPEDKFAVIDKITMFHSRPIGQDYGRFELSPYKHLEYIMNKYAPGVFETLPNDKNYSAIKL